MLSVCFALLLLATVTVAGTLAYENLSAYEWAQETDQTISAKLVQEQRAYDAGGKLIGLEDFEDDKVLVPLTESAQYDGSNFDKYGMPTAEGYVDQIVEAADTRKYVIGAFEMLFTKSEDRPVKKHGTV